MFERLTALFWKPRSGTIQPGSCQGAAMVTDTPPRSLALPRRLDSVEDWVPPPTRSVPAKTHAEALVAAFQAEGRTGSIPHWHLTSRYPELCWLHGFKQMSHRDILQALGQVCAKVRPMIDRGDGVVDKVTCYVIPEPTWAKSTDKANSQSTPKGKGNVFHIGNMEGHKRPIQAKSARTGMRKYAGKGMQQHRADIVSAVA